jgi:hypothetical protein
VFSPSPDQLRVLDQFAEELGALLVDNWPNHILSDGIRLRAETRVGTTTFTTEAISIVNVFDVTLFGALNQPTRYEIPFRDEELTVESRIKAHHRFKQIMVDFNI